MSRLRNTMKPMSFSFVGLMPLIIGIVMALIMLLPVGTGANSALMPHLVLITVYDWARHRPLQMPTGLAAILGLILDLWLGVPLGINILLMVLTRVFVLSQIRYLRGRAGPINWLIFGGLVFVLYGLAWVVSSLVAGNMLPWQPLATQMVMTIALYPIVTSIYAFMRVRME